jgi:hypothetical protein
LAWLIDHPPPAFVDRFSKSEVGTNSAGAKALAPVTAARKNSVRTTMISEMVKLQEVKDSI